MREREARVRSVFSVPDHHQCLLIYQIKVKVKNKLKADCFNPGVVPVTDNVCFNSIL